MTGPDDISILQTLSAKLQMCGNQEDGILQSAIAKLQKIENQSGVAVRGRYQAISAGEYLVREIQGTNGRRMKLVHKWNKAKKEPDRLSLKLTGFLV